MGKYLPEILSQHAASSCVDVGLLVANDGSGSGKDDKPFLVKQGLLLYFLAEVVEDRHVLRRDLAFELINILFLGLLTHFMHLEVVINQVRVL